MRKNWNAQSCAFAHADMSKVTGGLPARRPRIYMEAREEKEIQDSCRMLVKCISAVQVNCVFVCKFALDLFVEIVRSWNHFASSSVVILTS